MQRVMNHDTKTRNTFRWLNKNIAEINHFEETLTSLSSTSANDDGFRLDWIQWQAIQCEPAMNWLEAVRQQRDSSLIFQWNIQQSK